MLDVGFGSTTEFCEERAAVVAQWICGRTRGSEFSHISTAVAVIFLGSQVAGAVVGG